MRNNKSRLITAIVGGTLAAAALAPAGAQAQTATLCDTVGSGLQVDGVGATFQAKAQTGFGAIVSTAALPATPPAVAPSTVAGSIQQTVAACSPLSVSYASLGSGAGRTALGANAPATPGVRNLNYEFGGADEPPTAAQITAANLGSDQAAGGTGGAGDAALQTIPIAAGAITVSIQLPTGCVVDEGDRALSGATIEGAFSGDLDGSAPDTWGDVFGSAISPACANTEFSRVVRSDSSGTTYQQKAYLNAFDNTEGYNSSLGNTAWPTAAGGGNALIAASGNSGVASALAGTASSGGGIAYIDLATARSAGFGYDGTAGDTKFWVWAERPNGGAVVSPARDDAQTSALPGANCTNVTFSGTPANTSASWEPVTGVNTTAGYPVCTLTYALSYTDLSNAGYTNANQAEAAGDYLRWIVSTAGQSTLAANDYSALPAVLPANIVTKARAGAATIGF